MRIRTKILLLVLPLLIVPLSISGIVSSYAARNGITQVAVEFLRYKTEELAKYAQQQWRILEESGLDADPYFVGIAKKAIADFASGSATGATELILALDSSARIEMNTAPVELMPQETATLQSLIRDRSEGWMHLKLAGVDRVAMAAYIKPFDWYLLQTEQEDRFYAAVEEIVKRSAILIMLSVALSALLLVIFSRYLTDPMRRLERTMSKVMETSDLSLRAEVQYSDEIGTLSASFNGMVAALDDAYGQIKNFALDAALAHRRERKVRNIFQKYVPESVIEQIFNRPEGQLTGDDRVLSVLFSDIVGFTSISEQLKPSEVVDSLNHYFERMVEIIMGHKGIVDKYIGDAIMAFFGAPLSSGQDALDSVRAGLDMIDALGEFNAWQASRDRPPFFSGVGINYGKMTIGNIGSDRKMDYTVIGDMVNLASRIEGLTRVYHEPLLVSGSVYREVKDKYACRFIDKVAVKGRHNAISIFSIHKEADARLEKVWKYYHAGVKRYYNRRFEEAQKYFSAALRLQPEDLAAKRFAARCAGFIKTPPPNGWTGVVIMREK